VRDSFLTRELVNLGLVANAAKPLPGSPASVPAFFAGWLAGELAPHLLTLTVLDSAYTVGRHGWRDSRRGLLAAFLAAGGYAALIARGQRAHSEVEQALRDVLGSDYEAQLAQAATDLRTPWRSVANPFRMAEVDVVASRKLPYHEGGKRFELDVYRHRDARDGAPTLLQIHGGGWVIGEKEQQGIPLMMRMAADGWICAAMNYPLSPRARWPEHIVAVKRAIGWLREHAADYGADPSFLAVTGGSAGGHLAAMAALSAGDASLQPGFETVDTSVQACVPLYGVYDFTDEDGTRASRLRMERLLRRYVMATDAQYPEDFRAASPLYRVRADAPPFFVLHGTNDTLVPVADARAFVARLRSVSHSAVGYAELHGAQHAFDIFTSVRSAHVVRGVERFLEWTHATARARSIASR
jgi:acetyl esterase/lipase